MAERDIGVQARFFTDNAIGPNHATSANNDSITQHDTGLDHGMGLNAHIGTYLRIVRHDRGWMYTHDIASRQRIEQLRKLGVA